MDGTPQWSLDELVHRVGLALEEATRSGGYPGAPNGRVRDVPDQRVIRWYASTGLVDRPVGGRGRGARYGVRHLRQLVAIKRLQAQGLPLAEIQARLVGADDVTLDGVAQLPAWLTVPRLDPADARVAPPAVPVPAAPAPSVPVPSVPVPPRFWARAAMHPLVPDVDPVPVPVPVPEPDPVPLPVAGWRLPGGVVLVLPPAALPIALPATAVAELEAAARPLLAVLARYGLIPPTAPADPVPIDPVPIDPVPIDPVPIDHSPDRPSPDRPNEGARS